MDHTSLLASILVRYPEIGSVKVLPDSRSMRLCFFLKDSPELEHMDKFSLLIEDSIQVLVTVNRKTPVTFNLSVSNQDNIYVIELVRDIHTITLEEISLIASLMRQYFPNALLYDGEDINAEEGAWYDEFIQHMLEDIGQATFLPELIGFREDNRVLVFDKSVV